MVLSSSHPKKLAYFDLLYRAHASGKKISNRMLKKSASFVLGALGGSTYRTEYAFASSLAAAAPDSLFDHPSGCSDAVPDLLEYCVAPVPKGFFNNLLGLPSPRF